MTGRLPRLAAGCFLLGLATELLAEARHTLLAALALVSGVVITSWATR